MDAVFPEQLILELEKLAILYRSALFWLELISFRAEKQGDMMAFGKPLRWCHVVIELQLICLEMGLLMVPCKCHCGTLEFNPY